MKTSIIEFVEQEAIEHLRHYLPAQAALKDFVHHNTLHAFQKEKFHDALWSASKIFGYSTYLSVDEYRNFHKSGRITNWILDSVILKYCDETYPGDSKMEEHIEFWKKQMFEELFEEEITSRTTQLRSHWKENFNVSLDKIVHPFLFRLLSAYLDQGISSWTFPVKGNGLLDSLRILEGNKISSLFKKPRARKLLLDNTSSLTDLLLIVVGKSDWFEQYIFEQQFAHPGWSGFVSVVENQPETLLSERKISLYDLIYLELLFEIDALDSIFGEDWYPLYSLVESRIQPLFQPVESSDLKTVFRLWQEAYEWSYFDAVLKGIQQTKPDENETIKSFQAMFCIDDREYSFRRHIEFADEMAETFGTPGFFGVEFYFQPENGKFYTKACPAPVNPTFLIREKNRKRERKSDPHFNKQSHSLLKGWLISSTLGFWSAIKLFVNLFMPSVTPATAYSFAHMDKLASLEIESTGEKENGLKIGFTVDEMVLRVGTVLKSIGLTSNFAPIIYAVGHGGSSVNNPYYAGYDCGACCGRPGAVNARVFAYMANKKEVRTKLKEEGLHIPDETLFIGAMHDTTRDEIEFYDEVIGHSSHTMQHEANALVFRKALTLNAKERSYRFDTINSKLPLDDLHKEVKKRSVSLFEPRPEWNHTDNALCIVGRKHLYNRLYLDKRPFINSYDCTLDPEGKFLLNILNAAVPVCGGINLEYYFSRVDQANFGSGTKLPHNVVGLFGLANGIDGDLRPGLPSQMIEIHEAVRILFIIEHKPATVLKVIQSNPKIYEWIENYWVVFSVIDPDTHEVYRFEEGKFTLYQPLMKKLGTAHREQDFLPVINKIKPTLITV